ncbi:MAG: hypothetical protein BroJett014_04090 [Planctomycetota bacterium]|nr:hypothetical protein [Planctomycetota bacterium]GIK51436.1 MAG: hypothetical protein BroJett014_04090 [Planctomycetota bacterium]
MNQRKNAPKEPRRKAVLYARVGGAAKAEGDAIEHQLHLLRKFARSKKYEIIEEFSDVGSARNSNRPGYSKLVASMQRGDSPKPVVVTMDIGRLTRNLSDLAALAELDIELHLLATDESLSNQSSPSMKFKHASDVLAFHLGLPGFGRV